MTRQRGIERRHTCLPIWGFMPEALKAFSSHPFRGLWWIVLQISEKQLYETEKKFKMY
jgi:hypothetical protein